MTEPQDMPAGAELDRLVAEKVMGWKFIEELPDMSHRRKKETFIAWDDGTSGGRYAQFDPSVDIANAWEVVEKLRLLFSVVIYAPGSETDEGLQATLDGLWNVSITKSGTKAADWMDAVYGSGNAPTAPHAICLAALKAVTP